MRKCHGIMASAVVLAVGLPALARADKQDSGPEIRIGMVETLFRDMPENLVGAAFRPFGSLMESQTGIPGDVSRGKDALSLGREVAEGRLDLAVFHGVEFAWAQQRYPELRPLMIAVNQKDHLQAYLITAKNPEAITGFAGLKGKKIEMAKQSREHCHLFFQRGLARADRDPRHFLGQFRLVATAEDVIDDVLEGATDAGIVDNVALDCYKRRKPGRCGKLTIVSRSEVFPASVVAYRENGLDQDLLHRFRDGMLAAKKTAMGRQLMMLWKLSSFEPVPADYTQTLRDIIKAYPGPIASPDASVRRDR